MRTVTHPSSGYKTSGTSLLVSLSAFWYTTQQVLLSHSTHACADKWQQPYWHVSTYNTNYLFISTSFHSTEFKDILRNDANKRHLAKVAWQATASRILKVLHTFASEVTRSPAERKKYFSSRESFLFRHFKFTVFSIHFLSEHRCSAS